ncbi:MAG: YCF48-related protein [Ignavibacteria bacterium]
MKKIFCSIMFIFFVVSDYHSIDLFAQPGWITQQSGTGNDLYSVSFVDTNRGMAVGANGIILGTTNGGETWIQQTSNTFALLHGVSYIDENTAIAVGSRGIIVRTTDGGYNWFNQESGTTIDLHAVSFAGINNGTAVGGMNSDSGIVLHTTNGGLNWVRQTIPTTKELSGVSFTDENHGTAVGYYQPGGTILHTTNGGINWVSQSAGPNTDWLRGVHFVNPQVGMAVGLFRTVIKTTDGGATWTNLSVNNPSMHFDGVFLSDPSTATIVGYGGQIWRTTDGGTSWTRQICGRINSLLSVFFSDQLHGTIVGAGGTILHTNNGGHLVSGFGAKSVRLQLNDDYTIDFAASLSNQEETIYHGHQISAEINYGEGKYYYYRIPIPTYLKNYVFDKVKFHLYKIDSYGDNPVELSINELLNPLNPSLEAFTGWKHAPELVGKNSSSTSFLHDDQKWIDFDVTELFLSWLYGEKKNNGFAVKPLNETNSSFFTAFFYESTASEDSLRPVFQLFGPDSLDNLITESDTFFTEEPDGIREEKTNRITEFKLQNYPNPFNPSTTISFSLPQSQNVELKVFDMLGNEVALLLDEYKSAGEHKIEFNGSELSTGIYFYQMKAGDFIKTKKLVLLK